MKRIGKWLLRLLSAGLILALAVAALPYAGKLISLLCPTPDPVYATTLLKREMAKVGKLTCMEYTDTGIAAASTSALLLGEVQKVSVPYEYKIALGIDLDKVQITHEEGAILLTLPEVVMLHDSFVVTGDAQIEDFWLPLSQSRYQRILDDRAAACREEILSDKNLMAQAKGATEEKAVALYRQLLENESLAIPVVNVQWQ
ncbi:MAG: DUF4230 domain-containing protein [Clostridia bacterium]|nr:DUF4230 domain-containing protein [Clostridia bacterium]